MVATPDFSILAGDISYLHSLWCIGMVFFKCCTSLELITDNIIINAKEALKTSETLPFWGQSLELIPKTTEWENGPRHWESQEQKFRWCPSIAGGPCFPV